jgi:hypothetical protein
MCFLIIPEVVLTRTHQMRTNSIHRYLWANEVDLSKRNFTVNYYKPSLILSKFLAFGLTYMGPEWFYALLQGKS